MRSTATDIELRRSELARRFDRHVRERRLLRAGQRVLVALSGGLDSVTLLHLLRFALRWRLELVAAHYDHGMRAGSAADAEWVRGLCRAWDVPLIEARAWRPPSSEAQARRRRYGFLRAAARAARAAVIVTAHHADDQAETVLFRLLRGTGTRGLAGIPAARGPLRRPLLPFARRALRAYAAAARIGWRDDPTNADRGFARNRLRHEVLPTLEAAGDARRALLELAVAARRLERAWERWEDARLEELVVAEGPQRVELARAGLQVYSVHDRSRLLRRLLRRYGIRPDRAGTRAALEFITRAGSGVGLDLPNGFRLERVFDRIVLRRPRPDARSEQLTVRDDAGGGRLTLGGRTIEVAWGERAASLDAAHASASFDAAFLRFPLTVRGWRPGDRIRLDYGSKKLKKLFAERRVARWQRPRLPLLVQADGRVVWVPGLARAAHAPEGAGFEIRVRDAAGD